jgi:photosystem II stability/assembly factor-like uncharacterized protein
LGLAFISSALAPSAQLAWAPVGPAGGDARAFAAAPANPSHLYLGTTNSWLYESFDSGASWHRLAKMPGADSFVLDHIVVDPSSPQTIYVAAWRIDSPGGGLWVSYDNGLDWAELPGLHGQSVFAFAAAPSDPHTLFAGTLDGVYRSSDSGATWSLISPPESHEIHEVESLAIDPANPDILYAGTWHLPWKTEDGGKSWKSIKQGIIEDSDVFSIVIDPDRTSTIYLSACSGIYKSDNAGALFRKIQGIPSEARRTRVLMQDPANRQIVYAGTTEGLYKTEDAGKNFRSMTAADVIVNDVLVDPRDPNHVLLATDRGGVLSSQDAGKTFTASNAGISERKVKALLVDRADPTRIFAGVVNDKNFGGVFASTDGGQTWSQTAKGLDGRDVYVLAQTAKGDLVAGTNSGIFLLDPPEKADDSSPAPAELVWEPRNTIANTLTKSQTETVRNTRVTIEKKVAAPLIQIEGRVAALDVSGDVWLAATSFGLLTSSDQGQTWQGGPVMGSTDFLSVASHQDLLVAANASTVVLSKDGGQNWWPMPIPQMLTGIHGLVFSPDGTLWLGAREGVYYSPDLGKTWMWVQRLPLADVDSLSFDPASGRVLASSSSSNSVYGIAPKTITWKWWSTGDPVTIVRAAGDRLVAASLSHGVLLSPPTPEPSAAAQPAQQTPQPQAQPQQEQPQPEAKPIEEQSQPEAQPKQEVTKPEAEPTQAQPTDEQPQPEPQPKPEPAEVPTPPAAQ